MQLDVLAFAAHPDDVELFCGGTIARFCRQGKKCGIVDLTLGELSTRGTVATRKKEADKAAGVLGLSARENLEIPDGRIGLNEPNRLKVIEVLRRYRPQLILVPYHEDRHPDHRDASQLVSRAAFYSGLVRIETEFEAFRPDQIIYYYHHKVDKPTLVYDISDSFNTKLQAVECYRSQFFDPASQEPATFISSKLFLESIEARARYFGFQIGVKYGEPFFADLPIKIHNFKHFFA